MPAPDWVSQWWYQELRGWQAAIAGLVGFLALVVGALVNFRLNRRRDATLREAEALSVATALYGEILLLRERIAIMAKAVSHRNYYGNKEIDDQFVKDYSPRDPIVFSALISKIGMLDSKLVLDIARFYDNFEQAKMNLSLLIPTRNGMPVLYHVVVVLKPAVAAIYDVRPALREIERMAGIIPTATDPDSGPADVIVSSFEDEIAHEKAERKLLSAQKRQEPATGPPTA